MNKIYILIKRTLHYDLNVKAFFKKNKAVKEKNKLNEELKKEVIKLGWVYVVESLDINNDT